MTRSRELVNDADRPALKALGERLHGVIIPLPWLSPPLTGNDRGHTRYSPFKRVKGEAQAAIRHARPEPLAGPVVITLHWQIPNRIHRDADNLAATHKAAQDALVAEGVIPGDWWAHVPETRQRIHPPVAGIPAAMWLEITEDRP